MGAQIEISTAAELLLAASDAGSDRIIVSGDLRGLPTFRLSPGKAIEGRSSAALHFAPGQDGIQLSSNNRIEAIALHADGGQRVIFNDSAVEHLGRLELRSLLVTGCIRLLVSGEVRGGHVEAHDVDIAEADARGFEERPTGYGVQVVPGVFTVWNQQSDAAVSISADLTGLSAGRAGAPVRGSGIFVSGAGDVGGRLMVQRLETGSVYSDGGIPPGTADRISGGVFTVFGTFVDSVMNHGPVTTYGANDMVLDNWGTVDRWTVEGKVTSSGPSAIGFVNFGTVGVLVAKAPIETFGQGARGFNVYAGTVHEAEFDRIVTHGDGAVGLQISQPVGRITVRRGIETFGAVGESLVKGVLIQLPATALSVKPGGSARKVAVLGGLVTHGTRIDPLQLHGTIETLEIAGGIGPLGAGFDGI